MSKNDDNNEVDDWEYAKNGIAMWLNNDPEGAEAHFKARKENTRIFAGYAFTTVLNAVVSYEIDKIEAAQLMLRELEGRCSQNGLGWIRSFRSRIFGAIDSDYNSKPFTDELEEKIILADCLMCSAILTFLTQDISGLMRGSWLLRKAWKIYQQTYSQIYELHKVATVNLSEREMQCCNGSNKSMNNSCVVPVTPIEITDDLSPGEISFLASTEQSKPSSMVRSKTTYLAQKTSQNENIRPTIRSSKILQQYYKSLQQMSDGSSNARNSLSQIPKTFSAKLRLDKYLIPSSSYSSTSSSTKSSSSLSPTIIPNEQSILPSSGDDVAQQPTIIISTTSNHQQSRPSRDNLFLELKSTSPGNGFIPQVPFSCPESVPSSYNRMDQEQQFQQQQRRYALSDIDLQVIKRLMGAISFGYGIFQLSVSLLPPNLMKLISFFGFEGNKRIGLSCLTYAKSSEDMRAPFATLALLWYYTIGAQLFHMDGNNMKDEIVIAKQILKESQETYATSAIYLFFRGRLKRLQCNVNVAIELYDAAYRMSAQKELKLLCLHEVGWCRLIQLDFGNAMLHFHELKLASNFSKSFYTYMTTICQGAFGRFDNLIKLRSDILNILNRPGHKESQIDKFISRRLDKLPSTKDQIENLTTGYFKLFVYEMLFLWNTLHSCSLEILNIIITDCSNVKALHDEPSIGLANLLLGSCYLHLKNVTAAKEAFRKCIEKRDGLNEDVHLSAFAHFELSMLLIKEQTDSAKQEAKIILSQSQKLFKNYDFESRLSARIHSALRNLQ